MVCRRVVSWEGKIIGPTLVIPRSSVNVSLSLSVSGRVHLPFAPPFEEGLIFSGVALDQEPLSVTI